jgi:hypothetical protein
MVRSEAETSVPVFCRGGEGGSVRGLGAVQQVREHSLHTAINRGGQN